jgi:hypothetical protein
MRMTQATTTTSSSSENLIDELLEFQNFGRSTFETTTRAELFHGTSIEVPTFLNEFWTAKQRQSNPLHRFLTGHASSPSCRDFSLSG